MSKRELALLRGIHVGGKHLLPMPQLIETFTSLGCTEVVNYIQSGNIVYTPPAEPLAPERIVQAIEARFGFAVPVVLRSRQAFAKLIAANPFASPAADPKLLHTVFLAAPLTADQLASLRALAERQEKIAAVGNELYLSLPNGAGRSKLASACIAPTLPPTNTMRNWATVLNLAQMLGC